MSADEFADDKGAADWLADGPVETIPLGGARVENRDANDDYVQFGSSSIRAALDQAAHPAASGKPTVQVRVGEIDVMATEAERVLIAADAPFYVRGGLVRPIIDEVAAAHGRKARTARLKPVDTACLIDHMARSAAWCKWDRRNKALVATNPPGDVASILLSRDGEWSFRRLAGVITTPTLRPDGTILSSAGYDEQTQLLLMHPPALPAIPDQPTKADAVKAIRKLDALLDGFPFVDPASRAAALSGLISPVVRGAMAVVPMHVATAPVPGSGKSYLIDLASAIATGDRAPVLSAGRNEEETEKRLGAALLSGQAIIAVDNVNGDLGGDALCQMIERPVVAVRPLGVSQLVKIESRACLFGTGNNIRLVGDMTRRVILCSLDPDMERPELRSFKSDPLAAVLKDRGAYVAAALTVARAYAAAGYPGELIPLASFDQWSRTVRSALVWLGYADPAETIAKARADDPVVSSLTALLSAWLDVVGDRSLTAGEIIAEADLVGPHGARVHSALREALVEVADSPRGLDAKRLGRFLGRHDGRIVGGLKIKSETDQHRKQKVWRVTRVG